VIKRGDMVNLCSLHNILTNLIQLGVEQFYVEASIIARLLFERFGFSVQN